MDFSSHVLSIKSRAPESWGRFSMVVGTILFYVNLYTYITNIL